MVLIVGWGGGVTDDLGEVAPTICPNCHNAVFLHHIRSDKRISAYFVPVVPYASNAYLACPICRHGLQLKPEHVGRVDRMRATTAQFRRGRLAEPAYRAAVDRFWTSLGTAHGASATFRAAPAIPAPIAPPGAPSTEPDRTVASQLEDLGRLHEAGALTDDEFAIAKRRVLEA
jgi:uncharacterized protein YbaR (Trm112 family)